jgi:hypothetical protein
MITFVEAVTRRAVVFVPSDARELILRARFVKGGLAEVIVDGRPMGRLALEPGGYREYPIQLSTTDEPSAISTVTLAFEAMPNPGEGFRLDRLSVR